MKNKSLIYLILILVKIAFVVNNPLCAQQVQKLAIGDSIPEIKYSKWLQGNPISSVRDGKMYVLEFWATWCGACIASMEHLSELSKKYEGKAVFLGVNVLEQTNGLPYERSLPKVIKFINGNLNKMTFSAFADNNEEYLLNNWLKPVGSVGLPTTFVVHKGRLIWVGHPAMLDEMIDQFVDGSYDMNSFKNQYEKQQELMEASRLASEELDRLIENGDYASALKIYDQRIKESTSPYYKMQKFKLLVEHFEKGKAGSYLKELIDKNDSGALEITLLIRGMDNLPNEVYDMSLDLLRKQPSDSMILARMSSILEKRGNKKEAISVMQQAIEKVKMEIDGNKQDVLLKKALEDYQNRLHEIKKSL